MPYKESEVVRSMPVRLVGGTAGVVLAAPHVDVRGSIIPIHLGQSGSVHLITSAAGSRRADHWHREDWHVCYVLSGSVIYTERPVGSNNPPTEYRFLAGQAFWTGPQVEHGMFFPVQTNLIVIANRHRESADYERDLVRLGQPLVGGTDLQTT